VDTADFDVAKWGGDCPWSAYGRVDCHIRHSENRVRRLLVGIDAFKTAVTGALDVLRQVHPEAAE
jgi:hypothetical protein